MTSGVQDFVCVCLHSGGVLKVKQSAYIKRLEKDWKRIRRKKENERDLLGDSFEKSLSIHFVSLKYTKKMGWNRLIRFVGEDNCIYRGEPVMDSLDDDIAKIDNLQAKVIEGHDIFDDCTVSDRILKVKKLLGPLTPDEVPVIRCIALNYVKHIQETGATKPPTPVMFLKPRTAVADHGEAIPIPKIAQKDQCDYEGELCVIIKKAGKDIPVATAMEHVGGYTVGNDMSARGVQVLDPNFVSSTPQLCFSKGFDKYCPLGPMVVAPSLIDDPNNLKIKTTVNGQIRQDSSTNDFLFNIAQLISFLSQGTTLERGTVIMTGTPGGVGMGFNPPRFLQDQDTVEITVEKIGSLTNSMKFL